MPTVIAQRELRNQNASIMAAVAAGESFVITRNGTPVAELRPVNSRRRTFVPKAELVALVGESPHIDALAFRADLDRIADQSI
jgi:prevent-host-death family protein